VRRRSAWRASSGSNSPGRVINVINRGINRRDFFGTAGAAIAFETCLFPSTLKKQFPINIQRRTGGGGAIGEVAAAASAPFKAKRATKAKAPAQGDLVTPPQPDIFG
jgi:hypothetical protein